MDPKHWPEHRKRCSSTADQINGIIRALNGIVAKFTPRPRSGIE